MDLDYTVTWTEEAAAVRDKLDDERREKLLRGVEKLSRDPYTPVSRPIGGEWREVRVTSQIIAEYAVHRGQMVIIVVRLFDDADILEP